MTANVSPKRPRAYSTGLADMCGCSTGASPCSQAIWAGMLRARSAMPISQIPYQRSGLRTRSASTPSRRAPRPRPSRKDTVTHAIARAVLPQTWAYRLNQMTS